MTPSTSSQTGHVPGAQVVCVDARKPFLRNNSHSAAVCTWEQFTGDGTWLPLDSGNQRGLPVASCRAPTWRGPPQESSRNWMWVPGTESRSLRPKLPHCFQRLSEQAKERQPHVITPSHRLDEVPGVSSSPWLCMVRGLAGLLLLSSLESSQPSGSKCMLLALTSFWFRSQFLDSSAHSCQLCPAHFCHDLKGNMSNLGLSKP